MYDIWNMYHWLLVKNLKIHLINPDKKSGKFKTLIKENFHTEVVHIIKYITTKTKSCNTEIKTDSYDKGLPLE